MYLRLRLELKIRIFKHGAGFRWHHRTTRRLVLRFEVIADLLHGHPFDAVKLVDVLNDPVASVSTDQLTHFGGQQSIPFEHEQAMRMATNIWMNGNWVHELIVFTIEVVELVQPQLFNVLGINPAVAVSCFLDEHHWRPARHH